MKVGIFTILLLLLGGFAQAGDVSCQVDLLKPKINAVVIEEEINKPATMTVAEARLRLQNSRNTEQPDEQQEEGGEENDEPVQTEDTEVTAKKESRMGGIFDILLPSKLRNPVK